MDKQRFSELIQAFRENYLDSVGEVDEAIFQAALKAKSLSSAIRIFNAAGYDDFEDFIAGDLNDSKQRFRRRDKIEEAIDKLVERGNGQLYDVIFIDYDIREEAEAAYIRFYVRANNSREAAKIARDAIFNDPKISKPQMRLKLEHSWPIDSKDAWGDDPAELERRKQEWDLDNLPLGKYVMYYDWEG